MRENKKRPHQSQLMRGANSKSRAQDKDTQKLYNKKVDLSSKVYLLKRHKIVYEEFCKDVGTVNMIQFRLEYRGNIYTKAQVRSSLEFLVKHKYISYWGKDKCDMTGHKALWYDLRIYPPKKFNLKKHLSHER